MIGDGSVRNPRPVPRRGDLQLPAMSQANEFERCIRQSCAVNVTHGASNAPRGWTRRVAPARNARWQAPCISVTLFSEHTSLGRNRRRRSLQRHGFWGEAHETSVGDGRICWESLRSAALGLRFRRGENSNHARRGNSSGDAQRRPHRCPAQVYVRAARPGCVRPCVEAARGMLGWAMDDGQIAAGTRGTSRCAGTRGTSGTSGTSRGRRTVGRIRSDRSHRPDRITRRARTYGRKGTFGSSGSRRTTGIAAVTHVAAARVHLRCRRHANRRRHRRERRRDTAVGRSSANREHL